MREIPDIHKPFIIWLRERDIPHVYHRSDRKSGLQKGTPDYPESQVQVLNVPVWPDETVENYLDERLQAHLDAENELPLCTDEERWAKPERWALMKKGLKRALKLYPSEDDATAAVTDPKQFVEHRPGENTRCLYYCPVAPYCSQFRRYMEEKVAA